MNKKNVNKFLTNNFVLLFLLFIFFIARFLFLLKEQLPIWDEAVYIGMGKYLWSFGSTGGWEIIRPIIIPLIFGLIWKLNLNAIFFSKFVGLIFSIATLFMVYLLGKRLANKEVGLVAAVLLAVTPLFYNWSTFALVDIPSTFFALLSIYFFIEKKLWQSGIFAGVAFLTKFPQGLIVVALSFFAIERNLRNIKTLWKYFLAFFSVAVPFLIFNYFMYGNEVSRVWHGIFRPFIMSIPMQDYAGFTGTFFENVSYYVVAVLKDNILLVFFVIGMYYFLKNKMYKREFNLINVALFLFLIYLTYIWHKEIRYSILFIPYFVLIAAYGIYSIVNKIKFKSYVYGAVGFILLIIFLSNTEVGLYKAPDIEKEFYKYFLDKDTNNIITNDPVPAAYVDKRFYYIYNLAPGVIESEYDRLKDNSGAIIFIPKNYYCTNDKCLDMRKEFFETLGKENRLVFEKSYFNDSYYIFER